LITGAAERRAQVQRRGFSIIREGKSNWIAVLSRGSGDKGKGEGKGSPKHGCPFQKNERTRGDKEGGGNKIHSRPVRHGHAPGKTEGTCYSFLIVRIEGKRGGEAKGQLCKMADHTLEERGKDLMPLRKKRKGERARQSAFKTLLKKEGKKRETISSNDC